jgi:hypothetical protein|eukprot:GHVR01103803.1.p1 GENE.GHVR01103803.1~~GHVR01103803.1.p1  ORF type:complete len:217 (-),score=16.83 GHVR01103803.1:56-706(-)
MNNYIKTIQEVLAKPISEFTKTGIAYGAKRAALMEALEVLKTAHNIDLKWSDFLSPLTNGGKPNPKTKSTSSVDQWFAIKDMFIMALPKTEQYLSWTVLKEVQAELDLTNNEKDKRAVAVANKKTKAHDKYQDIAHKKSAIGHKIGSQIKDFRNSLKSEQEVKEPTTPKKPFEKVVTSSTTLFKNVEEYKGLVGNKKEVWIEDYRKLMARLGVVIK